MRRSVDLRHSHRTAKMYIAPIYSKITSRDQMLMDTLVERLSFKHPAAQYTKSRWPGNVKFFNTVRNIKADRDDISVVTGRFPTGLLFEVNDICNQQPGGTNVETVVDDRPVAPRLPLTSDVLDDEEDVEHQLRDYQLDVLDTVLAARMGIVKVATGGGKTWIFGNLVKRLLPHVSQIIVFFRSKMLVSQTYEMFMGMGIDPADLGRLNSDFSLDDDPPRIILCNIQSAHKLPKQCLRDAEVVLFDEVHEFTSATSLKVLKQLQGAWMKLGFSATPFKDDDIHNYRLRSFIGPLLCDVSTPQLIKSGILANAECTFHTIAGPDNARKLSYQDVMWSGVVLNQNLNRRVSAIVEKESEGRIMVLVRYIKHGEMLKKMISRHTKCFFIHGSDDYETRHEVLEKLKANNKEKVCVILSAIGYTGLDTQCHTLVNCVGGRDPNLTIQIIGRGLRKSPDKDTLAYHDFLFKFNPYLQKHSERRLAVMRREKHRITLMKT